MPVSHATLKLNGKTAIQASDWLRPVYGAGPGSRRLHMLGEIPDVLLPKANKVKSASKAWYRVFARKVPTEYKCTNRD